MTDGSFLLKLKTEICNSESFSGGGVDCYHWNRGFNILVFVQQ